jgi:hypothetical protein
MNKLLFPFLGGISLASVSAADHTNFIAINLDDVGYGDFSYERREEGKKLK